MAHARTILVMITARSREKNIAATCAALVLVLLMLSPRPAVAGDGADGGDTDSATRAYGSLTHRLVLLSDNPEDWHDSRFELGYSPRKHAFLGAFAVDSERFGLVDATYGMQGVSPHLQVGQDLAAGFGILAGIRRVEYTESLVHIGDITLERYFGNFRAAYTAYPAHSDTVGDTLSHRVSLAHYLDGGSFISLAFATGSEVEKPFDARSIIETDFNSVSLWGKVRLTPALGLSWSADYTDLDLPGRPDSRRRGFNLGLEYDF